MNKQTRINLERGFVKPVGQTYITKLVPYYGTIDKDNEVKIQTMPLIKPKQLILDRDSMLFPLYAYAEVHNLKMYNKLMVKYNDFIQNYVLSQKENEPKNLFVVLEANDLKELYSDDNLVVEINNYLMIKRIRKR